MHASPAGGSILPSDQSGGRGQHGDNVNAVPLSPDVGADALKHLRPLANHAVGALPNRLSVEHVVNVVGLAGQGH